MQKVNLREKLALFSDYWNPRIVGELNGQHVKVVKFQGEFVWHDHAEEDEFFLVLRGGFQMDFRDQSVTLRPRSDPRVNPIAPVPVPDSIRKRAPMCKNADSTR